jgi:hypothetical protein
MKDNKNKNPQKAAPQQAEKKIPSKEKTNIKPTDFALGKQNYIMLAIGAVLIVIGFILMAVKGDIYGFRKLHLSTIFVMLGFLFEIYAIMKRPKVAK